MNINHQSNVVSSPVNFGVNYTEIKSAITAAATTNFNCALGNVFAVGMDANITTLTFSNIPATGSCYSLTLFLKQDGIGSRTITWPAAVKWPSGAAPVLTTTVNKTDVVSLVTWDGGTVWFGFIAGQNY